MATDIKISQMPSAATLEGSELIPIVQGGSNKSTTVAKIKEGLATTQQIENKVDKDGNKVLSDENFTTTLKNKLDGVAEGANNYTHPNTAGNKHIPSGGSSGQILKWSSDGTAVWGAEFTYTLPAAGTELGGVKQGAAVTDAAGETVTGAEFNALLASLRAAGIIATAAAAAANLKMVSAKEFVPPMTIQNGELYIENGITYKCIQTSKLPISNKLSDLVGYYVEIVE